MSSATSTRILIVDDDADLGLALSKELASAGYRCDLALSGPAALREVEHTPFDAIISDLRMAGMNGLELLTTLTRDKPHVPVIIMSGLVGSSATDAIDKGAFHYLTKPLDVEQLRSVIEQAIGDRAHTNGPHQRDVLLPIGSTSRALLARIALLSSSRSPVLILGESGTGKELVARAIHEHGNRAGSPFVAVNTAALPEHLLESELFGHVRGAFSGATHARRGLLAEADHGTVLLDEIGDMPLGLQAKLLRVIESGEVRAVGSDRSHFVDVRFLAATHRDLRGWVDAGRFRADLYFRLSVLELTVPALRDRRSEVPALVTHFLARAREKTPASPVRFIDAGAMQMLTEAQWPGNIRELASTIERLVVLGQSAVVTSADLSLSGMTTPPREGLFEQAQRGSWSLEELNQHYADWVLGQAKGDKLEAARTLGVNVSTLYRWLRKRRN